MHRIYFDHNATSPLSKNVKEGMISIMDEPFNPSSIHFHGRKSKKIVEDTRDLIMKVLGLEKSHKAIFCSSCTEANNLVLSNFKEYKKICSGFEHPSVKNMIKNQDIVLNIKGTIDLNYLRKYLIDHKDKKVLISVMYANNEIGTLQPINKIVSLAKEFNCLLHCDITQALGKVILNTKDVDFISFGVHKFGGPVGIAVLLINRDLHINPISIGGGQEYGLRAGTQNVISIYGVQKCFEDIENTIKKFQEVKKLRDYLEDKILSMSNKVKIIGSSVLRLPNTSSICMPGIDAISQVIFFDLQGISISAGSACSSGVTSLSEIYLLMGMSQSDAKSCIRISLSTMNTKAELLYFLECWKKLHLLH